LTREALDDIETVGHEREFLDNLNLRIRLVRDKAIERQDNLRIRQGTPESVLDGLEQARNKGGVIRSHDRNILPATVDMTVTVDKDCRTYMTRHRATIGEEVGIL
jgi:ATPase subunit of ABC transporter with duplicated ATPase domains